jgi:hypothetical protein
VKLRESRYRGFLASPEMGRAAGAVGRKEKRVLERMEKAGEVGWKFLESLYGGSSRARLWMRWVEEGVQGWDLWPVEIVLEGRVRRGLAGQVSGWGLDTNDLTMGRIFGTVYGKKSVSFFLFICVLYSILACGFLIRG